MIIYNVTLALEPSIEQDWIQWMKETHIPDVLSTNLFEGHRFCRVVGEENTFAIQYFCKDMATLQKYQAQFAPALQKDHTERYKGKFGAFRTLLEEV